ncbi:MAG: SUMF1/EgtB/PvdO family nonheme iron enzyme [bacterium]|nr:SUMF1/EgtB/PvdO family nonheme iron enzyme [bacterium]
MDIFEIKKMKWQILTVLAVLLFILVFSSYFMGFSASDIFRKSRDSRRIFDLKLLENIIGRYLADGNFDLDGLGRQDTCVGERQPTIYVSVPYDAGWKLPDLPAGWSWGQVSKAELQKTNGLGWLPLNLEKYSRSANLPIDLLNIADSFEGTRNFFYAYVCDSKNKKFQLAAKLESNYYGVDYFGSGGKNDIAFKDGGKFAGLFEAGNDFNLLPDDGVFCPAGMVWVGPNRLNSGFCIDAYEASWSEGNRPQSLGGQNSWSSLPDNIFPYVNQAEAQNFCQSVGKRLPEDYEWFLAARGTPDDYLSAPAIGEEDCHHWNSRSDLPERVRKPEEAIWQDTAYDWSIYNKGFIKTGTAGRCRSAYGAFDMVGNLFEFTAGRQSEKKYKNISLPRRNYILALNKEGIPIETIGEPVESFNGDYFWLDNGEEHIFLRGGSWFDEEKAGVHSLNLILNPQMGDYNVGFRCAR